MSKLITQALVAAALMLTLPATAVHAQQDAKLVSIEDKLNAALDIADKQRRITLAGEMNLTDDEREPFWDLYNEYAGEIMRIDKDQAHDLAEFARNYDTLDAELAERLIKSYFDQERRYLKVREKYLPKFKRVLPMQKVARFYQIDNKLNTVFEYGLASQVPLVQLPPE